MKTLAWLASRSRTTARMRQLLLLVALFACVVSTAHAASAGRLRATGWPLATREAEALFATALRSSADSIGLAAALARAEQRLQSAGWLDAALTATWDTTRNTLDLAAQPGPRYRWRKLTLALPTAPSKRL